MKKLLPSLALAALSSSIGFGSLCLAEEDYKTFNPDISFTSGVSTGLGKVNSREGIALIGNLGARILKDGFVPDIVNPVYVEVEFGPMFTQGESIWIYSTHLRWDFIKNSKWTFFGIGGLGGNFYSNSRFGSNFDLHPRFGVGTFWALDFFDLRAELSHEAVLAGVSFPF